MAVTAIATQQVQQDIISQLGMSQHGSPALRQLIMSLQRTNLRLSVTIKSGTNIPANMAVLVAETKQAIAKGLKLDATLMYAQTTREVDELAAYLQAQGVAAVKYHAKLPVHDRNKAHAAFQQDGAAVMVASLAFGMGIGKQNIRRIIHYGYFGVSRVTAILRGSKAKMVDAWMQDMRDAHGKELHGAGSNRSEEWWKGVAGVLLGHGFLESHRKKSGKAVTTAHLVSPRKATS